MSISGMGLPVSDIGGFAEQPSAELLCEMDSTRCISSFVEHILQVITNKNPV
jgi:hypothetical protein